MWHDMSDTDLHGVHVLPMVAGERRVSLAGEVVAGGEENARRGASRGGLYLQISAG